MNSYSRRTNPVSEKDTTTQRRRASKIRDDILRAMDRGELSRSWLWLTIQKSIWYCRHSSYASLRIVWFRLQISLFSPPFCANWRKVFQSSDRDKQRNLYSGRILEPLQHPRPRTETWNVFNTQTTPTLTTTPSLNAYSRMSRWTLSMTTSQTMFRETLLGTTFV